MKIKLGQASFGEKDRGHALLGASPAATNATSIVHQMDIQGTAPPGIQWEPYWSGFLAGAHYIVARTAPDPSAKRSGMVRSRSLFIPAAEIGRVHSLGPAMQFLLDNFHDRAPHDDVVLETEGDIGTASYDLAAALVDGSKPVVWALPKDFSPALKNLWHHLWPAARTALSFRLAFSPQDVSDDPMIVVTQPTLVPRWTGFRLVRDQHTSRNPAVAMLTGESSGQGLARLVDQLAIGQRLSINDLSQLIEIYDALNDPGDLADVIAATRLLCHLAPEEGRAQDQKHQLVELCCDRMPGSTATAIRMARNLQLDAIQDASAFWTALRRWAAGPLFSLETADTVIILTDAIDADGSIAQWRDAIHQGVGDYLMPAGDAVADALWPLLLEKPALLEFFSVQAAGAARRLESSLASRTPRKAGTHAEHLRLLAARLNLPVLHAALCAATFNSRMAIQHHLEEIEPTAESLTVAISGATDAELIDIAVGLDNTVITERAAQRAVADVTLLSKLDVTVPGWRRVWRATIGLNLGTWSGPEHAPAAMEQLLAATLDGEFQDALLLSALSQTPLANQLDFPRRPELWDRLPAEVRARIFDASLSAWIERFVVDGGLDRPEPPLAAAIRADEVMRPLLERLAQNPQRGIELFQMFDDLEEWRFRQYLDLVLWQVQDTGVAAAETVGRLVVLRQWNETASYLADRALKDRRDLRPAMPFCANQIGWLDRFLLDLPGGSKENAKWRLLEEIGADLYPMGAGDQDLWGRSGGKHSDIPIARSGREGWQIVIRDLEKGKGTIDVRRLIEGMVSDFPGNKVLQKIRNDRLFK